MRKELDEQLVAKYPLIFQNRHGDISTTAMCWGFECGDGWFNIIDALCANIQSHINNSLDRIRWAEKFNTKLELARENGFADYEDWKSREPRKVPEPVEQVVAIQVKEKFGGLRFYYTGGDDYIQGLEEMAYSMSIRTCEICGVPGTANKSGWIRTLCEEHRKC